MSSKVGIVMGSRSDWETVQDTCKHLDRLGIAYDVQVCSAHRSPHRAHQYAEQAEENGYGVIIAAAGGAAHLAGVIASLTCLPVIGIPIHTSALGGVDSLYSTVQMPAGVPVATVGIGSSGARNAAVLAAQILSLADASLRKKLKSLKAELARSVDEANEQLQQERS